MITSVLPATSRRPMHGGNLQEIAEIYGLRPDEVVDFSSSINPAGPPARVVSRVTQLAKEVSVLVRYPEADCASLTRVIAEHLLVDPECVIVANGSAALLDIALRALRPKRCLLPIPAFSEYGRALSAAAVETGFFPLNAEDDFRLDADRLLTMSHERGCDFWILTNPHNPSGNALGGLELLGLVEAAGKRQITVLVDEAFVDYSPELSISRAAMDLPNLVVLRSLTKFYGMAGLRVGYALTSRYCAKRLRLQVPSWPVSGLAIAAAIEAISDAEYAQASRSISKFERDSVSNVLRELGLRVFPSFANFLLSRLPSGGPSANWLRDRLITQSKVVIRDCSSYQGLEDGSYFRIAVRDHEANRQFIEALKGALSS